MGSALGPVLEGLGHTLVKLSTQKRAGSYYWDPLQGIPDAALQGVDGVVHLAGKSINCLWTAKNKAAIYHSRVSKTALLAKRLAELGQPPRFVICASGIHICPYLDEPEGPMLSSTAVNGSFLAELVKDWELASLDLSKTGTRLIHLRMGVVMSPRGGMLQKLLALARYRLMPIFGSGEQAISWISLDDWLRLVVTCIQRPDTQGPINAVTPYPIRQRDFARLVAAKFGYKPYLRLPETVLRLLLGQMADELLLKPIAVQPQKLKDAAFPFRFERLQDYLHFSLA